MGTNTDSVPSKAQPENPFQMAARRQLLRLRLGPAAKIGSPVLAVTPTQPFLKIRLPWEKGGQATFAGTARRVLGTNGACPLSPSVGG